jgi:hypothetical protein
MVAPFQNKGLTARRSSPVTEWLARSFLGAIQLEWIEQVSLANAACNIKQTSGVTNVEDSPCSGLYKPQPGITGLEMSGHHALVIPRTN